ncbi:MAG: pantoate--beta-alanine ligase [Ancrocorticia sp.]|jgi:pantoate--beta-alanine ligase|nr:pantoate--beta-alanine ligase [Ancrocorticia sp.]MCI1932301.1 pantoate--beta-alanine ligase [Ancrocorticia sp.]
MCVVRIARTKAELRAARKALPGTVGLVMTMGALHEGHLSLVRAAEAECDSVVVSIFVNPLQFGPGEDYENYPRDLDADIALLDTTNVKLVFAPQPEVMYPRQPLVRIDPGPIATRFEGKTRPTHFAGVLQVVNKVFNLVRPDYAYFGQKDAQQLALVRTMVADLDMPLVIRSVPIKREASGLALSSRNTYLSENDRIAALALNQALTIGRDAAAHGASPAQVRERALAYLTAADGVKIDYLDLVDPDTFEELPLVDGSDGPAEDSYDAHEEHVWEAEGGAPAYPTRGLLITAAWVGPTRLIDNMEVEFLGA